MWRFVPAYRGGHWWLAAVRGGRRGVTGTGWEAPEDAGWEFLAGHAAGNDGNYRPG